VKRRIHRAFLTVPLGFALGWLSSFGAAKLIDNNQLAYLLAVAVVIPTCFILGTWTGQGER
jgi:hypothetical protein